MPSASRVVGVRMAGARNVREAPVTGTVITVAVLTPLGTVEGAVSSPVLRVRTSMVPHPREVPLRYRLTPGRGRPAARSAQG